MRTKTYQFKLNVTDIEYEICKTANLKISLAKCVASTYNGGSTRERLLSESSIQSGRNALMSLIRKSANVDAAERTSSEHTSSERTSSEHTSSERTSSEHTSSEHTSSEHTSSAKDFAPTSHVLPRTQKLPKQKLLYVRNSMPGLTFAVLYIYIELRKHRRNPTATVWPAANSSGLRGGFYCFLVTPDSIDYGNSALHRSQNSTVVTPSASHMYPLSVCSPRMKLCCGSCCLPTYKALRLV
jgi:hypothetical protein